MIATIITILIALYWLMIESDWLTVRLPVDETIKEYDYRVLSKIRIETEQKQIDEDKAYPLWLKQRYTTTFKICYQADRESLNHRDARAAAQESLDKRRSGEMIYQRGSL